MDPELLRWGWLVLALVLLLLEIITSGFVLAAFGIGALAAAVVAFLGLGLEWQLVTFIVASAVAVMLSRRFADRITGQPAQKVGVDRVLGKRAVVLEPIDPVAATGRVRVEREEWRAQPADGEPIAVGTVVEVVGIEGTRLVVRVPQESDS